MKRFTRLALASGAGLALTLTAPPALAAPSSDPGSNRAQVEKTELSSPDGSFTSKTHGTTRNVEGHLTSNYRDQVTIDGASFDYKTHYTLTDNVTKLSSQSTTTENGETCRFNSRTVATNGETRTEKSSSNC